MKKNHPIHFKVTDDADSLFIEKAGKSLSKTDIASAILEAGVDAVMRAGKFNLPLRLEVAEEDHIRERVVLPKRKAA